MKITKKMIDSFNYYVHPDLPNEKVYAKNIDIIPAKKGIDKKLYKIIGK